ncbi:MAG: hypothetical protein WC675_01700 [Patescibacteria group bacterium]|jgi:hypothetical protein
MAKILKNPKGFSLIEVVFATLILATAGVGVLSMFGFGLKVIAEIKSKTGAITVANEIIEMIHNLPYNQVGTVGGLISGPVPQEDTINLNGVEYAVSTSVDYIDDPFDGTVALGTDELGNDYKKIRVAVAWTSHFGQKEIVSVTTIAPQGIESNEGSGILWINVINANGDPVSDASIHIVNHSTNPEIDDSSHKTNDEGYYYSSAPSANSSYQITVTKDGYSSDYTCAIDPIGAGCSAAEGNPNPVKPHATVIEGRLTSITFAIDQVATLNIHTISQTIPNEWQVNTDSSSEDQFSPALALGTNGNYYFVWQDFRSYAARIYSQSYDQQVNQWTSDLPVTTSNNQGAPQLALDGDNNIYFTWHDDRTGNQDIYLDKYDSLGNDLWTGAKKINTDSGSADQQYPKIIYNASSTAPAFYIAWKDERAGGGKSDIYLQKFDTSGNALWSAELKVNLNSSSAYQASDSASWTFDNLLDYVCNSGSCDGSNDIEVSGGFSQLVPLKTCQGTPDNCDTLLTEASCGNQSGCSWDQAGPCSGLSCSCNLLTEEADCDLASSCLWQAGAESCSGSCHCWSIGNRGRCNSVPQCSWWFFFCNGGSSCSCQDITNQTTCLDADCSWGSSGGSCSGSCSCSDLTTESICTQSSCDWDPAGPCSGTAVACGSFTDLETCQDQTGCSWEDSGSGYPTDKPDIYIAESLSVANLTAWDSFTETAVKNGGEIYYQLSDNNGGNWKYFDGSGWSTAGASDYNTAGEINDHIALFPIAKGKIMFKAFFVSNGSQQIQLDQIDIGYSYTTDGGGYSQSVDLAMDQDENVYVAWEDYQIDNYDIFIQKVDYLGSVVWTNDIRANTAGSGNQTNPNLNVDSNNDVYIVWQDDRNGNNDIYGQKYDSAGNNLWPTGDLVMSVVTTSNQENPKAVIDASNNLYIVWQDYRNGNNDIYSQKIDSMGNIIWPNDVRINSDTTGEQKNPDVIINQSGNLVITWQDNKDGNYDIMAAEYPNDPSAYTSTPNVPLIIVGSKKIGTSPDLYKYNENHTTDASGQLILNNIEWDTEGYNISLQAGSVYTIISTEPPMPISVSPGATIDITINLE